MKPTDIPFNDNQVTKEKVHSFIMNNLPDFSVKLDSKKKLDEFLNNDQDINKVILISKKAKTPPIYKALTSLYRDKIRFGFISSEANKDLVASEFPQMKTFP